MRTGSAGFSPRWTRVPGERPSFSERLATKNISMNFRNGTSRFLRKSFSIFLMGRAMGPPQRWMPKKFFFLKAGFPETGLLKNPAHMPLFCHAEDVRDIRLHLGLVGDED